jgi:cystathionine beta-lyase
MQRKSGFGNGNIFGIEALVAAYSQGDQWLDELKEHLKNNINFIAQFIAHHKLAIVPVKTEATFLIWLDCSALNLDDAELQNFFTKEAKLGLNVGSSFGEAGSQFMRLNIATSTETLQIAMNRLLNACSSRSSK